MKKHLSDKVISNSTKNRNEISALQLKKLELGIELMSQIFRQKLQEKCAKSKRLQRNLQNFGDLTKIKI